MSYPTASIIASLAASFVLATVMAAFVGHRGKFPLPSSERRIGFIDGLRGYLALSVLAHHFIIWIQVTRLGGEWAIPSLHLFNQLGAGGVALFFMTTGFVFYPRVLCGFQACSWPVIYIGRIFRIVPLVVLSVLIITAIIAVRTGRGLDQAFPKAALEWVSTWREPPLLGYPDSGRLNAYVLWSLWYEWQFYLFALPVCAWLMDLIHGRLPSWVLPLALLMVGIAARAIQMQSTVLVYLPLFAIGMLAYECQSRVSISRVLRTSAASIFASTALATGMVYFADPYGFALPLFGFFFVCVACGNDLGGLLGTKGALVLGECSYGIYLLHGIVLSLLFVEGSGLTDLFTTAQLPVVLPFTVMLVAIGTMFTHLLVERPGMWMGRQVSGRWRRAFLRFDGLKREKRPL